MLPLLILIPLLRLSAPATAQVITLLAEATVDSAEVTLGQVARVGSPVPGEAEQVAELVLTAAPPVGGRSDLSLSAVRDRLAELGVNRALWTLQGAASCRVSRVRGAAEQIDALQRRSDELRAGLNGPIISVPDEQIPDSLAGCIRQLLLDRFQPPGGRLTLQFDPSDRSALALQRPRFRFEPVIRRVADRQVDVTARVYAVEPGDAGAPADDAPGPGSPASDAGSPAGEAAEGRLVATAELRVRVELSAPVVVARATINRGQVLGDGDVELAVRAIGLTSAACRQLPAAVGQQARRVIRPGEVIEPGDLTPLALVQRNRLVTVWVRSGSMLIRTVGRAMQDGVYGEKILVRNEVSRQPFYGVVTGPDTVELDPTPVQEARSGAEGTEQSGTSPPAPRPPTALVVAPGSP